MGTASDRVSVRWGESVRWDDRRGRLYFVDCAAHTLHWRDGEAFASVESMTLPSIPTGVVLAEDGRVVVALADGLHVVDPDTESIELLTKYPEGLGGRANDANADLDGNLVTGTLNVAPAPGSYWWCSTSGGWRLLDDGIVNANGPVVLDLDGERTLVIADTPAARLYAYPYDGRVGAVGERRVFAETSELGGMPDGACADAAGGVWSCLLGAGKIVRFTSGGVGDEVETGVPMPSDVTFGGPGLDRMLFVSIAADTDAGDDGAPVAIEGTGHRGRPEPRFRL
jgi:sugar lactone lactonase YvrE